MLLFLALAGCDATVPLPPVSYDQQPVPGTFAAIAYSPTSRTASYSIMQPDGPSAASAAIAACGQSDCWAVITLADIPGVSRCGAVAADDNGNQLYWSFGLDHESAESGAMSRCAQQTGGCVLMRWVCAD